jgi:glucose-6-phosphate isomerase
VIALQHRLVAALTATPGQSFTAEALAARTEGCPELAYKLLEHLAANGTVKKTARTPWFNSEFSA